MANEYRLQAISLETLASGETAGRSDVSTILAEVSGFYYDNTLHVHAIQAELHHAGITTNPSYVYSLLGETWHGGLPQGVIDTLLVEVLRGMPQDYWPDFLEDDQDFDGFGFEYEAVNPTDDDTLDELPFEWNPYRPDVPVQIAESDRDTYEYLREQAELVRFQHNVTQAGDTTFPYQLIGQQSETEQFTLGSISRFKHPDYGLIVGRYIQFSERWTEYRHAWVGHDLGRGDWVGTNQNQYTDISRVIGIAGPFDEELGGAYGWTISQGRGLFNTYVKHPSSPSQYQKFTWNPDGGYGEIGPGPAIGVVLGVGPFPYVLIDGDRHYRIPAGQWAVDINGVTDEYMASLTGADLDDIRARLEALENAEDSEDGVSATLTSLQSQINSLDAGLTLEQSQRSSTDIALSIRISTLESGVWVDLGTFTVLENRVTILETDLSALQATEAGHYNALNIRVAALEAFQAIATSQISDLYELMSLLGDRLSAVEALTGIWMPVVDGSIPPTFIQLPDGSLTYTQVE